MTNDPPQLDASTTHLGPAATGAQLRELVRQTSDRAMASVCLPGLELCTANDQARDLLAHHGIDLVDGRPIDLVCAPEERGTWQKGLERRLASHTPLWRSIRRLESPTGDEPCFEFTWIPVPAPDAPDGHLLCYFDECHEANEPPPDSAALRVAGEDLEAIAGRLNSSRLLVFDPAGRLVHLGEHLTGLFADPDHALLKHETELGWPDPERAPLVAALDRARTELAASDMLMRTGDQVYHAHIEGYAPSGHPPGTLVLVLLLPMADDTVEVLLPSDAERPRALRARFDYLQERLQAIAEQTQRARWLLEPDHPIVDDESVKAGIEHLSPREREVYELLVEGYRVPTIAKRLFINQSTVRNHLSNVFRKLGVESQSHLLEVIGEHRNSRADPPTD